MYENAMDKYRSEFFKLKDNTITNDSVITLLNKMDSLTEKNTFYSIYKTEFIKKKYKDYDKLIQLFKKENSDFFERKIKNKNRVVFDGATINIQIENIDTIKTIWAISPNENSHPEIKNLISSSLIILRNNNKLTPDKKTTIGY